ncbi:MAG TPA: hypothetical protein DDX91_02775 [Ruminococcaceae bacterium]|nr:hypothetical protein [Oscillospiraceae bacterium]
MKVKVNLKQIGQRKQRVAPVDFEYSVLPKTVRELIALTAEICVNAYNERVRRGEEGAEPLNSQQITDMAEVGKIAFGINYGGREQDLDKARENALQSFEDGLYRIFIGENELEGLDTPVALNEGDSLTFIKLTMLAGRMW